MKHHKMQMVKIVQAFLYTYKVNLILCCQTIIPIEQVKQPSQPQIDEQKLGKVNKS